MLATGGCSPRKNNKPIKASLIVILFVTNSNKTNAKLFLRFLFHKNMADELTVHLTADKFKTIISNGKHQIIADEPEDLGGDDLGFQPPQLLLSALGACKVMTMRMYADRKTWKLEEAIVKLSHEVVKSEEQQTTFIRCHISLKGDLDEAQQARLLDVAGKCPLHRILTQNIAIDSNLLPD